MNEVWGLSSDNEMFLKASIPRSRVSWRELEGELTSYCSQLVVWQ